MQFLCFSSVCWTTATYLICEENVARAEGCVWPRRDNRAEMASANMWFCGLYNGLKCRCWCTQNQNSKPVIPVVRSAVHIG